MNEANKLTATVAVICGLACACAIWPDTIGATITRIMMILIEAGSIAGLLWLFELLPHRERPLPPPLYLDDQPAGNHGPGPRPGSTTG